MRRGTTFLTTAGLLLLAACTRTIIVREPAPQGREGSRPPPNAPPGPDRPTDPGPNTAVTLGVPPGHLPQPGECRVWIPGTPPGRQPRPRSRTCEGIGGVAPAGSWILYRPSWDRRLVHVRVVDQRRPGIVIRIRIFDIETEQLLREEEPQPEPRPDDRPREERPPEQRPVPPPEIIRPVQPPPEQRPPENKPPEQRPPEQRPPDNPPPAQPFAPSTAVTLDVPPGHLPDPGECRVWIPRTPPGQQPRPKSRPCEGIGAAAPAGSWILYRPGEDRRVVHVRVVDERRAGVVIRVRIFDIETLRLVREENP